MCLEQGGLAESVAITNDEQDDLRRAAKWCIEIGLTYSPLRLYRRANWCQLLFLAAIYAKARLMPGFCVYGGEGGIRTPDTGLGYTPLAGERLQPLGHLSVFGALLRQRGAGFCPGLPRQPGRHNNTFSPKTKGQILIVAWEKRPAGLREKRRWATAICPPDPGRRAAKSQSSSGCPPAWPNCFSR